jgi:hypothetical protein
MSRATLSRPADCIESVASRAPSQKRGVRQSDFSIVVSDRDLYGPKLMRIRCAPRPSEWLVPSRGLPLLVGAAVCSLLFSGCGGTNTASKVSTPSTTKVISSTSTPSPADAQILSAWLAAQQAFDYAALTSNANEPSLALTMVDPELSGVRQSLAKLKAAGDIGRGSVTFGRPQVTATAGSTSATVVSCIHDQEVEVAASTGLSIPGDLGRSDFELIASTMVKALSGWKLSTQTIGTDKCTGV